MRWSAIVRLIVIMVLGAVIGFMGFRDLATESKKAIDIYDDIDWSDLEVGDHVTGKVDFNIGPAVYNKRDGKTTSEIYCLVNLSGYDTGATMDQFIGIVVAKDADRTKLSNTYDDSYDWWQGNGAELPEGSDRYTFDGKLREMTSQEKEFFKEYIDECNQDSSDLVPYVIVPFSGGTKILIGIGALMIVIPAIILVVTGLKGRSKAKEVYEDLE